MGLIHSSPARITDSCTLILDAANYKSLNKNSKNLISVNPVPSSSTGYTAGGGTGSITYNSIDQAVLWTRDTYDVWGAFFRNNTVFISNINTTRQYTASFEWYSASDFSNTVINWELVDDPALTYVASANVFSNSVSIGNGWYRFSYTFTPLSSGSSAFFRVILNGIFGTQERRKTYFMWRKLQLEVGSSRTDFVDGSDSGIWTDISDNGNNALNFSIGTTNLFTDTLSVPHWDFSGVTSTIGSGNIAPGARMGFTMPSRYPIPQSGNFTISCWIKDPPVAGQLGLFANAGDADGFRYGPSNSSLYYLIGGAGGDGYKESFISYSSPLTAGTWNEVTAVYDRVGGFVYAYVNGILQASDTIPTNNTPSTLKSPGIVRSACCGLWTGKLAFLSTYSRSLSASEILQNYNALKGRFGK